MYERRDKTEGGVKTGFWRQVWDIEQNNTSTVKRKTEAKVCLQHYKVYPPRKHSRLSIAVPTVVQGVIIACFPKRRIYSHVNPS